MEQDFRINVIVDEQIRRGLDHYIIRHPVIYASAILFVISLVFFAFGTIKFQSLAIDIDKQGEASLERTRNHLQIIEDSVETDVQMMKSSVQKKFNIEGDKNLEKLRSQGPELVEDEIQRIKDATNNYIDKIDKGSDEFLKNQIKDLEKSLLEAKNRIETLKELTETSSKNIDKLSELNSEILDISPELESLRTTIEKTKMPINNWETALDRIVENWRLWGILFAFVLLLSGLVSYIVTRASLISLIK